MGRLLDQNDGMGVYSQYLTRNLLELDPHTHYSILLRTPNRRDLFRDYRNAETHVLPAKSILYWDQIVVARAARRLDVDLIFNPKFSVPFLSRRPSVFVHQGWDWYVNPKNYEWWDNIYIRLMLPLYDRKAARTLAISQATIEGMRQYAGLKLTDCVVSHAGIGPNFTAQRDEAALAEFRKKHALPQHYILTVARAHHGGHNKQRVYPGGNNERLLRAYRGYRQQGGTFPLVVVGFRIEEYLRSRGFTDADLADVRFLGFVPNVRDAHGLSGCRVLRAGHDVRKLRHSHSRGARDRVSRDRAEHVRQSRSRRRRGPLDRSVLGRRHRASAARGRRLVGAARTNARARIAACA